MRALALLLIIVNLAYLGWTTLIDVREAPQPLTAIDNPDLQRIVLASERDAAMAASTALSQRTRSERAQPTPKSTPTDPAAPQCVSIGPFQDLSSAVQASATLKSTGRESRQRHEQGQLWVGYWVNIPGFAKREDAETAVAKLNQNGITDVYVSLGGADEAANVISLGVFKETDRAQRMLAEAKSLGFPAQISERTRTGSVYWVDVDLSQPTDTLDMSALSAQPGKILRLEQRACQRNAQ